MTATTTDINECAIGTDLCEQMCNNTIGSYECSCMDGYSESGFNCLSKCMLNCIVKVGLDK